MLPLARDALIAGRVASLDFDCALEYIADSNPFMAKSLNVLFPERRLIILSRGRDYESRPVP